MTETQVEPASPEEQQAATQKPLMWEDFADRKDKDGDKDGDGEPIPHCNLVMKGGVTSGVVYPAAVVELARKYVFDSIGGTSVGAMAAAVTAAAEYGHRKLSKANTPCDTAGFMGLEKLSEELSGEKFLVGLFQPRPDMRPLLDALLGGLELQREIKSKDAAKQRLQDERKKLQDQAGASEARRKKLEDWDAANGAKLAELEPWSEKRQYTIIMRLLGILHTSDRETARSGMRNAHDVALLIALIIVALVLLPALVTLLVFLFTLSNPPTVIWLGLFAPVLVMVIALLTLGWFTGGPLGEYLVAPGQVLIKMSDMLVKQLPREYGYGICSGMPPKKEEGSAQSPPEQVPPLTQRLFTLMKMAAQAIKQVSAAQTQAQVRPEEQQPGSSGGNAAPAQPPVRPARTQPTQPGLPSAKSAPAQPPVRPAGEHLALTEWLSMRINELAGLPADGKPLTFADLEKEGIELKCMTTNLSRKIPYTLPFEDRPYLFNVEAMQQLFPENVVKYLKNPDNDDLEDPDNNTPKGHSPELFFSLEHPEIKDKFFFLPKGKNLPVVVAARMSLSFPVLMSAVPLWKITTRAHKKQKDGEDAAKGRGEACKPYQLTPNDIRRNWFSDGGICSNFPIHFFDAWYPPRPTFGINLDELPPEFYSESGKIDPEYLLGDNAEIIEPVHLPTSYKTNLPGLGGRDINQDLIAFLWSIVDTSMNYRDTLQSRLPSYYDRIVTVRLTEEEGGLNLNMPEDIIKKLQEKGLDAAREIKRFNLEHHQWVRLLALLCKLEERAINIYSAIQSKVPAQTPLYQAIDIVNHMHENGRETLREIGRLNLNDAQWQLLLNELTQLDGHTKNIYQSIKNQAQNQAAGVARNVGGASVQPPQPSKQVARRNMAEILIDQQLAATQPGKRYPYPYSQQQIDQAAKQLDMLYDIIQLWGSNKQGYFQTIEEVRQKNEHAGLDIRGMQLRVTSEL